MCTLVTVHFRQCSCNFSFCVFIYRYTSKVQLLCNFVTHYTHKLYLAGSADKRVWTRRSLFTDGRLSRVIHRSEPVREQRTDHVFR